MTWEIREGDVLERLGEMPGESVQCVVTSPPYWGLRDYGMAEQMGLEKTPEEYIEKMTAVFEEVRRVLRKDGTLWLNMGDSYARRQAIENNRGPEIPPGTKPKDMVGVPWRLALALQAAGWWLRRDVVWNKPNPMPESVTDRPTTAHEYVFLLAKAGRYFYDAEAVKEPSVSQYDKRNGPGAQGRAKREEGWSQDGALRPHAGFGNMDFSGGRNLRSVWTIPTFAFPEAHFATFPPKLPEICIKAGTSEKGACSRCGAPWARVVEKKSYGDWHPGSNFDKNYEAPKTVGWEPGCNCGADPEPCVVLDPFSGAGTAGLVARRLGRSFIGIELNPEYAAMSRRRIDDDAPLFNTPAVEAAE